MHSIILGLLLLLSCQYANAQPADNYTQSPDSLRGASVKTLIKQWGEPDIKLISPAGTTLFIYKTRVYRGYIAPPPNSASVGVSVAKNGRPVVVTEPQFNFYTNTPGSESLFCDTIFEANKQDKIIDVKVHGVGCR